jgi:hypothetical protein
MKPPSCPDCSHADAAVNDTNARRKQRAMVCSDRILGRREWPRRTDRENKDGQRRPRCSRSTDSRKSSSANVKDNDNIPNDNDRFDPITLGFHTTYAVHAVDGIKTMLLRISTRATSNNSGNPNNSLNNVDPTEIQASDFEREGS